MSQNYKLMNQDVLKEYLDSHNKEFLDNDTQLDNFALVYYLKNGEVLVYPQNMTLNVKINNTIKGFVFNSKEDYQKCIDEDYFPVDDKVYVSIFEPDQEYIKNINKNKEYFENYLQTKLRTKDFTLSSYYNQVGKLYRKNKDSPMDIIALGALVGNQLLMDIDGGKWILVKRYGVYNPYYEPYIIDKDKRIYDVYDAVISGIKAKFDLDFTYNKILKDTSLKNTTEEVFDRQNLKYFVVQ